MKYAVSALALALLIGAPATAAPGRESADHLAALKNAAEGIDEAADPPGSQKAWEAARAFALGLYPEDHPEIAKIDGSIAAALYHAGDIQGALAVTERAEAVLVKAGPAYRDQATDNLNGRMVMLMTLGRFAEARAIGPELVARRRAQYGDRPHAQIGAAYNNHASAEYGFGNYDAAVELTRTAIREHERVVPPAPSAAPAYGNLAIYLSAGGRLDEAIEAAQAAAVRLEALLPAGHPYLAQNLSTLAQLQTQTGRPAEAEAAARKAIEIAEPRFGRKQQTAAYMTVLANALNAQGKAEEGAAIATAALAILEADLGPDAERTLLAREALATALARQGQGARAIAMQQEVAASRARTLPPYHRDCVGGGDRLAELAIETGDLAAARDAQADAQALRASTYPADDIATLIGAARLGAIETRAGDKAGLERARAAATGLDERQRRIAASGMPERQRREIREGYGWALDAAIGAGDAEAAFAFAQRFMATATDRAVIAAAARADAEAAGHGEILRARQDAAAELERQIDRQLRAASRGAPAQTLEALAAERVQLDARLAEASARARLAAPAALVEELPDPLTLAEARAALGNDEALLVAAIGKRRSALFAVNRGRALMLPLADGTDAMDVLVRRVRMSLQSGTATPPPFDLEASKALHARLLPVEVRKVVGRRGTLLIAANGPLAALPFALLASEGEETPQWLVRDHSIVSLASLSALPSRRMARRSGGIAGFVAIGAPSLAGGGGDVAAYRSAGNARRVAELPPLPAAATELAALGEALSARDTVLLTGSDATEAGIRAADLARADVIAFATHGLVAGEMDGLDEPALIVTPEGEDDGLLTASEIMRLRLDADWVILSACNTAAGDGAGGEGLTGLARAFIHAGGRNLLASHWAVRDDIAAYLSVETVKRYGAGVAPAEALRQAMLKLMRDGDVADAAHPATWAPFVLVGR